MTSVYRFEPADYVGKEADDNTVGGLARRFEKAGQIVNVVDGGVYVDQPDGVHWGNDEYWTENMEAHFGCKFIPAPSV